MKKLITAFAILALTLSTGAFAQVKRTVAKLPTAACTAGNIENNLFIVTDGDDASDCTSGGGTAAALCICDGGVFVPVSSVIAGDLSAYVPVTKAGQQSITATGAGNDITLTAADDVVLAPTGDLSVTGAAGLIDVAGNLNVVGDGTIRIGVDDTYGGLYTGIMGTGADADLRLGDKVMLRYNSVVSFLWIPPKADPPYACSGTIEGMFYVDADTHLVCVCNGTGWVQVADGTTACS